MENNKFLVPAAVILAGLFIGGAVIWNGSHPTTLGTGTAPKVNIKDVKTDGEPFLGQANAPLTIAFWSDFQCPYCKQFEVVTLPQIIQAYVDTGKVKVVFKDFAFLGSDSDVAAEYSRSVWKLYPSQYFAWRTAMFAAQDAEGDAGFGDAASIDKLDATIAGINAAQVTADVAANKAAYDATNAADKAEAGKFGINATPSFVIGTQMIAGAQPFESSNPQTTPFKPVIDALLK